jgi:hypothetical protein
VVAGVHRVSHVAVEVALERDDVGTEAPEVEPAVASHERVEGPGDDVDAAVEAPLPLVQLQGAADVAALRFRSHAGDVGVQVEIVRHTGQEAADAPTSRSWT